MNPFLMIQADMAETQTAVDSINTAAASVERISLWQMAMNGGWIMLVLVLLLALLHQAQPQHPLGVTSLSLLPHPPSP